MSVSTTAGRTARKVGSSTALEVLTRAGFVGYGLFHLAVAWLAAQIALGHGAAGADQSGAFRLLGKQPGGRVLLIVVAIGLIAMTVWQLLLAAVGHRQEQGRRRTMERLASVARAIIYGALAWTAIKVVMGSSTSSSAQQEKATAGVLGQPAGRWLVGLAGLIVLAIGIGMIIYGVRKSFEKRLLLGRVKAPVRQSIIRLGQVGYAAKGVALGIVGALLLDAAVADSAQRSRGLDGALRTLANRPFGTVLLIIVAIGLAAFGVYCFFQAKYRKV